MSNSLSPPRVSLSMSTHGLRRSFSECSVRKLPISNTLLTIGLPAVPTSSRNWKLSVMDSLQIRSPSMPTLIPGAEALEPKPDRQFTCGSKSDLFTDLVSEVPPRLSLMKGSLDRPFDSHTPKQSVEILRSAFGHSFSHIAKQPVELPKDQASTSPGPKYPVEGPKPGFGNNHGKHRSSAASVHLYNMRISHHLRSESSVTSAAVTTAAPTAAPTRTHTPLLRAMSRTGIVSLPVQLVRCQRENSTSGFTSADVPENWGNVVRDTASSVYSTTANSPPRSTPNSVLHLPRPSIADHHTEHDLEQDKFTPTTNENSLPSNDEHRVPSSEEAKAVPGNLSSSNLSNGSKSSKTSRFKEDFESSEANKSTKRSSIVNLFHRARGKLYNDNLRSFDGASDEHEPRRLRRAIAFAERPDATGLVAKAITAQQNEKSKMYLSANTDKGSRDMFRRRSSSLSKSRTAVGEADRFEYDSTTAHEFESVATTRRASSAGHLKSECSVPDFVTIYDVRRPSKRRASSTTGRLEPEFLLPLFAESEDEDRTQTERRIRNSVVKFDPTDTTPESRRTSIDARAPSFQLNDLPFAIDSLPPIPSSPCIERALPEFLGPSRQECTANGLEDDAHLNLGSWSRYPSHTREKRTGSAGVADLVKTRDFAYDINPANIATDSSTEDSVKSAKKKNRKRKARTGLPKSKSMMIGKDFIRNYARIIRSPSVEWLSHGKGHRSSVSAGGALAHPELEVLPSFFAPKPMSIQKVDEEDDALRGISLHQAHKDTIAQSAKDTIELRQIRPYKRVHRKSFAAEPSRFDGSSENPIAGGYEKHEAGKAAVLHLHNENIARAEERDSALTWSQHYASCVKLPRNSGSMNHSNMSTDCTRTDTSMTISDVESNTILIDAMLASRNPSIRHGNNSFSVDDAIIVASHTLPGRIRPETHKQHQTMGSVASLRASSMDLLKKLALAEESERMRCLQRLEDSTVDEEGEASRGKAKESTQRQQIQLCSENGPMALGISSTVVEAN
jgi:hypothetical protein